MPDAVVATRLEQVEEPVDVAADVRARVLQRIANAGLGGHVDHRLEAMLAKQSLEPIAVGEVHRDEAETGFRAQPGQAGS